MKSTALLFPGNVKFDVFGFKKAYVKNFGLGLTVAVLIHILLIGAYYFIQTTEKSTVTTKRDFVIDLTNQPSTNTAENQPIAVSSPGTSIRNSIPVPVPDDKAATEALLPTQKDLSSTWNQPLTESDGTYKGVQPDVKSETPPANIPEDKPFEFVEKEPQVVESALPVYPELARKANLEGTVYVKVLVGKDGRPVKATAIKFDSEIFVQPSIYAAMKFVFTPGLQHKSPVMVWTTIPFKFRLNN